MSKKFTLGLLQQRAADSVAGNREQALKAVRDAAARGAQVICLQELFTTPYFCKEESSKNFDLAEPIPGPTTELFQLVARELQVVIVLPLFERRASGVYHNSAAVIDADGSLCGVYRKMHIPDDPLYYEKFYFTPGDVESPGGGFKVFQTRYANLGVLICWDQWYPEAARITTLLGADVLLYPTAIGWHPREKEQVGETQRDAWITTQRAHAISNGIYVAAVNRTGFEPAPSGSGIEFFGSSFVCDPVGKLIETAPIDAPSIVLAECDTARMETTRREWPFLRDRRIDAYQPIRSRVID